MKTNTSFTLTGVHMLVAALIAVAAVFAVSAPLQAHAATYAFVNTSGEVSIIAAESPEQALMSAFNISIHSGVMLLQSQFDAIVGDRVTL